MNNKDSRRHMGLDSSESIYRAWHYENAAKTIQINHSLLTEKMYPEETLHGIAELQKMKKSGNRNNRDKEKWQKGFCNC